MTSSPVFDQKVLVVDDDAEMREVLAEVLGQHRVEVLEAANGLEALLQVKRNRPAAIVLDLGMPRLGGLEALKRIHAFDPAATVVVVTGTHDADAQQRALALGASSVLQKPVDFDALLKALPSRAPARASILIVDDDHETCAMLEEFLIEQGYDARSAREAGGALRSIVRDRPDVVLLDINMPGLNGIEALPAIHAVAPGVNVIMVSGHPDETVARSALARGAFDYVAKPIDLDYLHQAVDTAVAMSQPEA